MGKAIINSNFIRQELNKLQELPPWGRTQENNWDRLSRFVYRVKTLRGVQSQARAVARAEGLAAETFEAYTIRRWFNHYTHDEILRLFYAHPTVEPEENPQHPTIDFYLRGLPFDLKISPLPQAYPETIYYAQQYPHHLAQWQYEHQSREGRYSTGNRLFIILHHLLQPELSWQYRRDFATLERLVFNFLEAPMLLGLTLTDQATQEIHYAWSGIIFCVK